MGERDTFTQGLAGHVLEVDVKPKPVTVCTVCPLRAVFCLSVTPSLCLIPIPKCMGGDQGEMTSADIYWCVMLLCALTP